MEILKKRKSESGNQKIQLLVFQIKCLKLLQENIIKYIEFSSVV